jgi:N utilization substance protein A
VLLDVIREGDVATGEDDDVELTEFSDESKAGLLKNCQITLDTAKVF